MINVNIKIHDHIYTTFEEFAQNIYLYYDEAFHLINTKKFLVLLKKYDIEKYNEIIKLRKEEKDNDAFIFKVQYVFNPLMELRFRTYKFKSLQELGKKILLASPKIDIYTLELIKNKLISYYMILQGLNKLEPTLFEKVKEIEEKFEENAYLYYFKMGFLLDRNQKIVYRRKWYDNISDLFDEILKPTQITDFAESFESSQYLFAWLSILGKDNVINKYKSIVSTLEEWEEKQ